MSLKVMGIIRKIVNIIRGNHKFKGSDDIITYWRSKGIVIGKGCFVPHPQTVVLDISRPTLLSIGDNVRINRGLTIQTHDYASMVFVNKYSEFVPSSAPVKIGNNVYFGQQCTVLKGVTIGDNCIIGFGSIVTKDIPANSVAAGRPAKVICSLDEYFEKRKLQEVEEAFLYAKSFLDRGIEPKVTDFYDDYPCFVDGENYTEYDYPYFNVFTHERFEIWKKNHKKKFNGFEDFMKYVRLRMKQESAL